MLNKTESNEVSISYPLLLSTFSFMRSNKIIKKEDGITGNDSGLNSGVMEDKIYIGNDKL